MHFIGEREKGSKIYMRNLQSIALANDRVHEKINQSTNTEPIHIQQKKKIDKIMLAVVKQRMFGQLLAKDNRTSLESYYTIDLISKGRTKETNRTYHSRGLTDNSINLDLLYQKRQSSCQKHLTLDSSRSQSKNTIQLEKSRQKRSQSLKFPQLLAKKMSHYQELGQKEDKSIHKKLKLNEKKQLERFKSWMGGNISNVLIYDMKVSRQTIINKYKSMVNSVLLDRFFHFFGFPQSFTLRQFCTLIENAANCNIKFIYFWVFGLFDENSNGILQSQDLFRFLQKFGTDNSEIESEIYQIKKYLQQVENNFKPREQKQLTEQILIVNHNLKLDQLKDLLKESEKERIDVQCVKNTCYHQTLLSIQHDYNQRDKLQKIEDNQLQTKRLKQQMNQIRAKLQNTPGLRLRDFYAIYANKRPTIFRYFIKLLTGEELGVFE